MLKLGHGFAGSAVRAGAPGDGTFLGDPPIGKSRVFVDQAKQLAPALEHVERAISSVAGDAKVERLFLPPGQDIGLADARVGQRQRRVRAGAAAAV